MKFKIAYNENNPMKTTRITQQRTRRRNRSLPMFRLLPTRRFFYLHDLFYLHHIPFIAEARQSVCPSVHIYDERLVGGSDSQLKEHQTERIDIGLLVVETVQCFPPTFPCSRFNCTPRVKVYVLDREKVEIPAIDIGVVNDVAPCFSYEF